MKLLPYWCNFCPKRFISEEKFAKHYATCVFRKKAIEKEKELLEKIAPKNRAERRKMAKKAGQIKDWKDLNG